MIALYCRDHHTPGPAATGRRRVRRRRALPRLRRAARLRAPPPGEVPLRRGQAHLRQLRDALLQAGDARAGPGGHALQRAADAAAPPGAGGRAPRRRPQDAGATASGGSRPSRRSPRAAAGRTCAPRGSTPRRPSGWASSRRRGGRRASRAAPGRCRCRPG